MYQFGATRPVDIVILDSKQGEENMDIAVRKRFILAPLAALFGLSLICLVLADTSSAAAPAGLNCQASDGKINGRGSTYQKDLLKEYTKEYNQDFCGSVAEQFTKDPAGNTMVAYNYEAAVEASATGSGAGIKATNCRTDAFGGTDTPYSQAQLKELDEGPGAAGIGGCAITFEPPFQPKPGPWPNVNDAVANVMALPVGGSDDTVAVQLTEGAGGSCPTTKAPTSLNFTAEEVSRIYGGDALTWNDAELVGTNPELKECSGAITRVVRQDSSGTTNILKQYLIRVDNARTGSECKGEGEVLQNWEKYFKTNTEWPGLQSKGHEGTCTEIVHPVKSGNPEELALVKATAGGVGYVDLAEAVNQPGVILASVRNATGTQYQSPSVGGGAANCLFSVLSLPGSSNSDAVGLNAEDNWSNNNETNPGSPSNHENATDLGAKYPIRGLTFDLVYTGQHGSTGEGPVSRLTADQRRTLYSYFTFILSSIGQEVPAKIHYAGLPSSWLPKLEQGFQANF